jgi:hypothetical protein
VLSSVIPLFRSVDPWTSNACSASVSMNHVSLFFRCLTSATPPPTPFNHFKRKQTSLQGILSHINLDSMLSHTYPERLLHHRVGQHVGPIGHHAADLIVRSDLLRNARVFVSLLGSMHVLNCVCVRVCVRLRIQSK